MLTKGKRKEENLVTKESENNAKAEKKSGQRKQSNVHRKADNISVHME